MLRDLLRLSDKGYQELKNAVFACVVANLTLILPFMIVMQVITTLIAPLYRDETLNIQRLWMLFGAGIAAAALYYVAYRNEYDKTYTVAYREAEHMRVEVAERMRKLPLSFFNQKDLSELTTSIMGDCANIEHTMSHLVPSMIANIITISLTCVLLALFDWRMALAIFATLPLSFLIIFASRGLQNRFGERHVQAKLNVSDQVQEYLDGIKVVKAFGLAGEKSRALDRALKRMMSEAILFEGIAGTFVTLAQMLLRVGSGLVVLVGTYLLSDGSLDAAAFLTFILISVKIYAPVTTIMTLLAEFFYMLNATKRMQVLRQEPLMTGSEAAELTNFDIVFDHVSFAYNEEDVIRDFSATMEQNRVTALVGPSGSGKSTISRLIARFWDVRKGRVLVGGRDVREIDPERLMHYVSFVFQDVVLFNDTVLNNIRLGRPNASESEVRRAAKMARCDEFVENLPQGYDSMLGENGCTLSGGERQRVSIARALLKDAPIVLLDEATASLDPENEVQIQAAISELVRGRTVIVIAHRLRTILAADKILVLEGGRLVEQGTGHQLLEQDGLFARLYRIQQESLGWSVKAAGN